MKRFSRRLFLAALFVFEISLAAQTRAQDTSANNPYSGDFWSRCDNSVGAFDAGHPDCGAQKDKVSVGQGPLGLLPRINRKSISTGTILGLRFQLVF